MQYDGIEWKQMGGPTEKTLNAMWGSSGDNIFAVGYNGVIARYDGTKWTIREPEENSRHDLYGIWGVSSTEVYAVGDNGKVFVYTGDVDDDGVPDATDNCPEIPNEEQTDTYPPPSGNNCGDACECEGNFDGDADVDGTDASVFKADFGRSGFKNPCSNNPECNGNFDCDLDVDGTDASLFKSDFGRSGFKNPCPSCPTDPWCTSYPE